MNDFVEHVIGYYGKGEIFDLGFTKEEVLIATGMRIEFLRANNLEFESSPLDRNAVKYFVLRNVRKAVY